VFMWQGIAHICDCFHCVGSHFAKDLLNNWGFYVKLYCCNRNLTNIYVHHAVITMLQSSVRYGGLQLHNVNIKFRQNWLRRFPICNMHADQTSPVCVCCAHCKEHAQNNYFWVVWGIFVIYNMRIQVFWDVTLCHWLSIFCCSYGTYHLHCQPPCITILYRKLLYNFCYGPMSAATGKNFTANMGAMATNLGHDKCVTLLVSMLNPFKSEKKWKYFQI
jgi:hypothetical protein